ncbi:MAG: hypothetical protein EA397_18020 [Deltaproteobacteria bacterium]|nr:MAG: hypothetical protein EA397_18020 [Deltaproteobacteria bacterium]
MSPSLPWTRWSTGSGPAIQLHAPPARVEALPWRAWVAPQQPPRAARPEPPPTATDPKPPPAPTTPSAAPATTIGQLARATAEAQQATAHTHTLWLRQQGDALEIIASMNRALHAALIDER